MEAEAFAVARLIKGVAWLIPYCARHHPLQPEKQRVPGTLSTPARTDQSCVRDARARGISLAAPLRPSPAEATFPDCRGRGAAGGAGAKAARPRFPAVDTDSFALLELSVNFVRLFNPFPFSVDGSVRGNTMRRERNRR